MKSMPGLPKPVQHLVDYVKNIFGIEWESDLTQSWTSADLWCYQHYYAHVRLIQFTNDMQKDWTFSTLAVLENVWAALFKINDAVS